MKNILLILLLNTLFITCKHKDQKEITNNSSSIEKIDTFFIENNQVLFISPSSYDFGEMKKRMGEEDFYTVADDANFYTANALRFLDSQKINYKNVNSNDIVAYKKNKRSILIPIKKEKWYTILFSNNKLSKIDLVTFEDDYKKHNNVTSINVNKGDISILLEEKEIPAIVTENIKKNNWEGEYFFEAKNKDDIKTTFNIKINSLNDIEIIINDDGTISKFTNINGQEVNNNKIKIVYNNSEDEMGIVFLEKVKNGYLISGNPIYFINPGSNEMPINKVN